MLYAITYDLNKPGQDYPGLYEAIKELGTWWHYLDSFWLLDSSKSAQQISDAILSKTDKSDYLLVIRVTSDYAGWLPDKSWDWIKEHI